MAEDSIHCSEGARLRNRKWRAANLEKVRETGREWHRKNRDLVQSRHASDPRRRLLSEARKRAKKRGLTFNVELDDIVVPENCPLLGIPLRAAKGLATPNSPSLDRILNNLGYIKGNVIVVSMLANACKNQLCADDIIKVGTNLKLLENLRIQRE